MERTASDVLRATPYDVLDSLPLPPTLDALPERVLSPAESAALERMMRSVAKEIEKACRIPRELMTNEEQTK